MKTKIVIHFQTASSLLLSAMCLLLAAGPTVAQQQSTATSDDTVVRIKTELVQTDVNVLDKNGRFVEGLRPEDFELTLDGKPQKIQFLERIAAGTDREVEQLASPARSIPPASVKKTTETASANPDRVRTIFFFVDDVHLSAEGVARARKALSDFVETRMRQNDQLAIVSTSGQIGFLQQLTDNKIVLHTAISRLTGKRVGEGYTGKTRISEYMANQIANHNDGALFAYLLESTKLEQQMGAGSRHGDHRTASSYSAEPYLKNRIRQIEGQAKLSAKATLATLKGLLATTSSLAGRKLLFVVSDGFIVDPQDSDISDLMRDVTEAAAQTGTVIYTIDLRDTSFVSSIDVSTNDAIDFTSRTAGLQLSERTANREPLQTMAAETGGRIILNPNSINEGVLQALDETADYYLVAWRPPTDDQRDGRMRLNLSIKDHPEWRVRLRKKFYSPPRVEESRTRKETQRSAEQKGFNELQAALGSLYPRQQAPVLLSTGYVQSSAAGSVLKLSMQIEPQLFAAELENENHKAELDVIGAAIDDRGIISTFKQLLTITPETLSTHAPVIWHQQLTVPSGLYQIRVAVRERSLGWTGSAMQWLSVPDQSQKGLQMSSLFIGSRDAEQRQAAATPIKVSVDRRFATNSILRFQTYIYSASGDSSQLEIESEITRNGERVVTLPPGKVPDNKTTSVRGIPYWAEMPLNQLPPGRYTLNVRASDRQSQTSASQQINFTIN